MREHTEKAIMSVEKVAPHHDEDELEADDSEEDIKERNAFLVSAMQDDDYIAAGSVSSATSSTSGSSIMNEQSSDFVGESLADISDSNFFNFTADLNDEFCSTDLF